jgi:hypothetical protein
MGGSKPNFVLVSKKFVSAQFQLMTQQAEADPRLVADFGLLRVGDEFISSPLTEHLIYRMAEAARLAAGGISHAELDRITEGPPLGFWIYMRRNRCFSIVDAVQSPDYDYYY